VKLFDMIYCYHCETLVSSAQSETIFRTGYYKVGVPLGICKDCAQKMEGGLYDNRQGQDFRELRLAQMA
jgi:hypothetical protein